MDIGDCLVLQVEKESGQISGEDVEASPATSRNPNGLCQDAERIRTFHLETIIFSKTTDLLQISVMLYFSQVFISVFNRAIIFNRTPPAKKFSSPCFRYAVYKKNR